MLGGYYGIIQAARPAVPFGLEVVNMAKILIVDDEPRIRDLIRDF